MNLLKLLKNQEKKKARYDLKHLRNRIKRQKHHSYLQFKGGFKVYWENLEFLVTVLYFLLKITRILPKGLNNAVNYQIIPNHVTIKNLPKSFNGYKILHISDLHIDGLFDHGKALAEKIKTLDYDLCVITGDFRFLTYGPIHEAVAHTRNLMNAIGHKSQVIGILGNHDPIEIVAELENTGIQMLVNESTKIVRGRSSINIIGVDDPHFYNAADLKRAMDSIKKTDVNILLAHSQETIPEAAQSNIDLYLCGHTHGGQICLPGGKTLINNTPHNFRNFITGRWTYQGMQGYTTKGVGCSGLSVRFNCQPDMVIHELHAQSPEPIH